MNRTRCCDKSICTECFLQLRRSSTSPLVPAVCPFCVQPNLGVIYIPPPWSKKYNVSLLFRCSKEVYIKENTKLVENRLLKKEDQIYSSNQPNAESYIKGLHMKTMTMMKKKTKTATLVEHGELKPMIQMWCW